MANLVVEKRITDLVPGADYRLRRMYAMPEKPVKAMDYPVKAWFTIKTDMNAPDTQAEIQVSVTTTDSANGQIESPVSPNWGSYLYLRFDVPASLTRNLKPTYTYTYDIKYLTTSGGLYVPEYGTLLTPPRVTLSES